MIDIKIFRLTNDTITELEGRSAEIEKSLLTLKSTLKPSLACASSPPITPPERPTAYIITSYEAG